jgi:hypothetical protein
MDYVTSLPHKLVLLTGGTDDYYRALTAASSKLGNGELLYALEYQHYDGPWVHPDELQKINGVLRYSTSLGRNDLSLTAMGYHGSWNSTDQVPQRALTEGLISRYDAIDPTDGGHSYRYSLSGDWQRTGDNAISKATAYLISYGLDLYSDFTYFLNDPTFGDQFRQRDRRVVSGVTASQTWMTRVAERDMENTVGLQLRHDNISPVALDSTMDRILVFDPVSNHMTDHVTQTSYSLYAQNRFKWHEKFRTVAGLRGDYYTFDVRNNLTGNSASTDSYITSPKLSMIFGPWAQTELYLSVGSGFHSNDAREITATLGKKATPLVRSKGGEVGIRTTVIPHMQAELTYWRLDFNSELLFEGDTGETEPGRPSRRYGVEFTDKYTPLPWLSFDANVAFSHARFTDWDIAGDYIPGAPVGVASGGVGVDDIDGFLASLRVQWFGPRPLNESDTVQSGATTIVNARAGYKFRMKPVENWRLMVDVFNLLNARVSDIDYYYTSRLPGEPLAGVADIHSHPREPREVRVSLNMNF